MNTVPDLAHALWRSAELKEDLYDQLDGLNFYADFDSLLDLFANPDLAGRKHHQDLLCTYLREESITPLPIRRPAAARPMTVDTVFRRLLRQPGSLVTEKKGPACILRYAHCMADTTRITVTLPTEQVAELKKLTDNVSGYVAEAVARQIRHQLLGADLQSYEDEHGSFSEEELAEARARITGATQTTGGASAA